MFSKIVSLKALPLYCINKDRLLCYRQGQFFFLNGRMVENNVVIPLSAKNKLLGGIRFFSRLLRMEPRCAERLIDNRFVVCYANKVWLLDMVQKTFSVLQNSRKGFSNPLNLCSDGTCVYWGDYGDNTGREVVNIYRLSTELKVEIVYSFPKGAIRHIHNIVWDEAYNRFYVLTGDLEEKSGIYMADIEWKKVYPVVVGQQQYRAVMAFPYEEGLIYATDSVEEKNNIYLLQNGDVKTLSSFPGSCIYGTETKDFYIFSSTVEPPEGRGFLDMFTYKLGNGIKDRYSHLVTVRKNDLKIEEVLKVKKDIWPMKLFQYGSLMFPKGQKRNNNLFFYMMACENDGAIQQIKL